MAVARDLSGAYTQDELITKFIRGLHRSVKAILQEHRHEFRGLKALTQFVDRATAIAESHAALQPSRHSQTQDLAVEHDEITPCIVRFCETSTPYTEDPIAQFHTPALASRSPSLVVDPELSRRNASISFSRDDAPPKTDVYTDEEVHLFSLLDVLPRNFGALATMNAGRAHFSYTFASYVMWNDIIRQISRIRAEKYTTRTSLHR